jgi:ParB family chromosome partitioning protein
MLHDIQHEARDSERVVALDPALVDPSPVRDRIDDAASDAQARLNASVAENGQRVPILVRRRPGDASRYVVVFGHRRLIAARANQVPVRAIVVDMAVDDALVAQGQENNERRNTSFIERCLFARRLRDAGLSNLQIAAALAIHPSLSSQMIGVAEALPEALVLAIGPAAEIGRPRWQALAALVKETGEGRWKRVMAQPGFAAAPSAERFRTAFAALSQAEAASAASARKLADAEGAYATIKRTGRSLTCVIPTGAQRPDGIAFADWLEDKLPSLRAEFLNGE